MHGAPATFQRMMDILLRPHQTYTATYLDDMIIHSERCEDQLDRLQNVLSELQQAGLTANPRKCPLGLSEARYMGLRIGQGLIMLQEKQVEAIRSYVRPTTKSQVRASLGLVGYYRCFIPNFSSIACPLTELTKKRQPKRLEWTSDVEAVFQALKSALTSSPVLHAPDFNCSFTLQTDASNSGLGAVLSQLQHGEEHPIVYISWKLTPAETRYATVERKAFAI